MGDKSIKKMTIRCKPEVLEEKHSELEEKKARYFFQRLDKIKKTDPILHQFWMLYRTMSWDFLGVMGAATLLEDVFTDSLSSQRPPISENTLDHFLSQFRKNPRKFVQDGINKINAEDRIAGVAIEGFSNFSPAWRDSLSIGTLTYNMLRAEIWNKEHNSTFPSIPLDVWDRKGDDNYYLVVENPHVDYLVTPFAEKSWDRLAVYSASAKFYKHIVEMNKGYFPKISEDLRKTALQPYLYKPVAYVRECLNKTRAKDSEYSGLVIDAVRKKKEAKQEIMTMGAMIPDLFEKQKELESLEKQFNQNS